MNEEELIDRIQERVEQFLADIEDSEVSEEAKKKLERVDIQPLNDPNSRFRVHFSDHFPELEDEIELLFEDIDSLVVEYKNTKEGMFQW